MIAHPAIFGDNEPSRREAPPAPRFWLVLLVVVVGLALAAWW